MSWKKLLANNTVTALAPTKGEIDKLRALAGRSLSDVQDAEAWIKAHHPALV